MCEVIYKIKKLVLVSQSLIIKYFKHFDEKSLINFDSSNLHKIEKKITSN